MLAWTRSFQKIHKLIIACDQVDPQKFNKTCNLMVNRCQNRKYSEIFGANSLVTKADVDKFNRTFPRVIEELTKHKENEELHILDEHFARLLEYVVPRGKKFSGLLLVGSYKMLEKEMTEKKVCLANIVGWMVEMFRSYFVVIDDIVDHSELRNSVPCWHISEEVGLNAINDAIFLYEAIFVLLNKYFNKHKNYVRIFELIHETALKSAKGQILDSVFTINGGPNFSAFTMSNHKIYCELKASYGTVYMPILLAMLMAEFPFTKAQHQQILNLSLKIGHYDQIRDDYMDCYEEKKIGKIGNDIGEGKCTWLVVSALERANSSQRKIIEKYYGKSDTEATATIKNLYDELNLPKIYQTYMDELFNCIYADIRNLQKELLQELFDKIAKCCKERDTDYVL